MIPKTSRLAENPVPEELQNRKSHSVKPYIFSCIEYFTADDIQIRRKNASQIPKKDILLQKTLEGTLEKKEFCITENDKPLTPAQQVFHDPNEIPKPCGVDEVLVTNCSEGTKSILVRIENKNQYFHLLITKIKQLFIFYYI